ncbi:hypothetical protein EJB05_27082, partial [Eragrostis curvula]
RKRGRPVSSQSAKNKMEHNMAFLDRGSSSSSSESDKDEDFAPIGNELAIVPAPQQVAVHYGDTDHASKDVLPVEDEDLAIVVADVDTEEPIPIEGIPADFYQNHLPKLKTEFMLEDEDGRNHETIYIGDRKGPGLSGGWGHFALFHKIKVDDVVIFQLVESKKFKVYIVRENLLDTIDGAFSQQNLEVPKKGKPSKEGASYGVNSNEDTKASTFDPDSPQSEDSSVISEDTTDGISFSDSGADFGGLTDSSKFRIVVDNKVMDREFQEHQRRAYYELCCSQKSYLHKNLLRHLNPTLIVGVISDTINIAERIRACTEEANSREDFMTWKKTLESFALLGMNVSFMIKRVNGLLGLPALSENLPKYEKYKDLKLEQACSREKVKALELQLSTVKDSLRKIDVDLGKLKSSSKKRDLTLQELATAPW